MSGACTGQASDLLSGACEKRLHVPKRFSSTQRGWVDWLDSAPWTHAVSVTFHRRDAHGQATNRQLAESALRHFLKVLDTLCFGHRARKGQFVASAVVLDWGTYEDHPHAHFCLLCPSGLPQSTFESHILLAIGKTALLNVEEKIEPYRDSGWLVYMIDHGLEGLIPDLVRIPPPIELLNA